VEKEELQQLVVGERTEQVFSSRHVEEKKL